MMMLVNSCSMNTDIVIVASILKGPAIQLTDHKATADYSNTELVAGIQAGDSACEDELYKRFKPGLSVMLDQRSGDASRAEDLAHDTLLTVLLRLRTKGIEQPDKLTSFVYQTAKFVFLSWHRKSATKTERYSIDIDEVGDGNNPESIRIRAQQIEATRMLISELRMDRDKEVLTRFYIKDQPKQEICDALELEFAHFDRIIHRARNRFKTLMEEQSFDMEVLN